MAMDTMDVALACNGDILTPKFQEANILSNNANVLLRMEGITKEFPGVKALDGVNLTVKAGTVHALMGENGAGKSTLMKCLFVFQSVQQQDRSAEHHACPCDDPHKASAPAEDCKILRERGGGGRIN